MQVLNILFLIVLGIVQALPGSNLSHADSVAQSLAKQVPNNTAKTRAGKDNANESLPAEIMVNGVEFILVPAGWFWHAIETGDIPAELHPRDSKDLWFNEMRIWQNSFYVAKYEARANDFVRFISSDGVKLREQYSEGETEGCAVRRDEQGHYYLVDEEHNLPITHLSAQLAQEFASWMGFRLLNETEWVKAARGTDKRVWPWGNEFPDDTFAAFNGSTDCRPAPVTAYEKGQSPYGAFNMAGNVAEHVNDWYNVKHDLALKDGDRNPSLATEGSTTLDAIMPK